MGRKDVTVQVRVSGDQRDRLKRDAARAEMTVSDYVRWLVFKGHPGSRAQKLGLRGEGVASESRSPRGAKDSVGNADAPSPRPEASTYRCPLPACRYQQRLPGKCQTHWHDLIPVRV